MARILVVEDDISLNKGIVIALKSDEYEFSQALNIKSAREEIQCKNFDLILLDINLPDGNGLDLLKEIKQKHSTSVIMLTANDMEIDIVTGLEMGADDYITKPFSLMVLRARVKTQLSRIKKMQNEIIIDHFKFNFNTMEFFKFEEKIELSKTEQKLLKILIENKGITLTRELLSERIWDNSIEFVDPNSLSVSIKRLRDKLEENPSKPIYIKTIYGIGYTWSVK